MEEAKVQPKFKTDFLDKKVPDDARIKELRSWCGQFLNNGLMPASGKSALGNLSFRIKKGSNEFIITPSGLSAEDKMSDDSFVKVSSIDLKNRTVNASGKREPSSESMLHYLIYQKRKDINAIFHGHCPQILLNAKEFDLPVTANERPYGTIELADEVMSALDDHQFVIMKNHGFLSFGKDMNEAGERALVILKKCS